MVNCANNHHTSGPENLLTGYAILILRYNWIAVISNRDLASFQRFKQLDLRNNSLNCCQHITGLNLSKILTDCTFKTSAPGTTTTDSMLYLPCVSNPSQKFKFAFPPQLFVCNTTFCLQKRFFSNTTFSLQKLFVCRTFIFSKQFFV